MTISDKMYKIETMIETYKKDFNWVLKVIQSCETPKHLKIANNCYKQFVKKWSLYQFKNDRNYIKLSNLYHKSFQKILEEKIKKMNIY